MGDVGWARYSGGMKAFRKSPATYKDIEELPLPMVGEIVGGELMASPRPASPHAFVAATLPILLRDHSFGRSAGWWILPEPELHFGSDVLVPDLAGWRRERMPQVPNVKYFTEAPDWVCEIESPSNASFDRMKKMPVYQRVGVSHLWLIEPLNRSVESFANEDGRWILVGNFAGAVTARVPPFGEREIDLAPMWLAEAEDKK